MVVGGVCGPWSLRYTHIYHRYQGGVLGRRCCPSSGTPFAPPWRRCAPVSGALFLCHKLLEPLALPLLALPLAPLLLALPLACLAMVPLPASLLTPPPQQQQQVQQHHHHHYHRQ